MTGYHRSQKSFSIFLGFDPREAMAFAVARHSIEKRISLPIRARGIILDELVEKGLYTRPTDQVVDSDGNTRLIDVLSKREDYDGFMSTEFAISRFLTPHLAGYRGWAMFADCDIMARTNLVSLFHKIAHRPEALLCVQHDYRPKETVKMDGQAQTQYFRKNWSSVMLFNCEHPANRNLTIELINNVPGRDLHGYCWLKDEEIGALDESFNWIPGHSSPEIDPDIVHWSAGGPWFKGYESVPFADEWRDELRQWAA